MQGSLGAKHLKTASLLLYCLENLLLTFSLNYLGANLLVSIHVPVQTFSVLPLSLVFSPLCPILMENYMLCSPTHLRCVGLPLATSHCFAHPQTPPFLTHSRLNSCFDEDRSVARGQESALLMPHVDMSISRSHQQPGGRAGSQPWA